MPDRVETIDLAAHGEVEGTPSALFVSQLLDRGLRYVRSEHWMTSARSLPDLGEPVLRVQGEGRDTAILDMEGVLVQASLFSGRVYASAAAAGETDIEPAFRALRDKLPVPDPSSAHEVTVTFWTYGPHGPQPSSRSISVPAWEEIRENYAASTGARLERIMDGFEPAHGGQLVLWHGRAGTGKTFALRALAWEWREWCDLHYIVDPDSFFGAHADYLMAVLMQPEYANFGVPPGFADPSVSGIDPETAEKPWRVLILEDTGELLTPDARTVIGQGLSRFLNVVDGLIGQGLRVLVLVTTNEEIKRLHPAVARPGRCAANVEFAPLSAEESSEWLARHDIAEGTETPTTLAALYARTEGFDPIEAERAAGFAA